MQEKYVYVFVRQDLSLAQQIVQSNHATLRISQLVRISGTPNLVLIGMPDINGLNRVVEKLRKANLSFVCWYEPDGDLGFTSIATAPLSSSEKEILKNYRLWHPCSGVVQRIERPGSQDLEDVGSIPAPRATHSGTIEVNLEYAGRSKPTPVAVD